MERRNIQEDITSSSPTSERIYVCLSEGSFYQSIECSEVPMNDSSGE
nr:hypothetical protein [uncultured Dysgonomonas sp.]